MDTSAVDQMYQHDGRMIDQNSFGFTFGGIGLDDGRVDGLHSVSWAQLSDTHHSFPNTQQT